MLGAGLCRQAFWRLAPCSERVPCAHQLPHQLLPTHHSRPLNTARTPCHRVTLHCLATYGSPVGAGASQPGSSETAAMDTDGAAAADDAVAEAAADAAAADAAADGSGSGGGGTWALDEAAVSLHFARGLLEAQPDWELGEFEEAWGRAVPEVRRRRLPACLPDCWHLPAGCCRWAAACPAAGAAPQLPAAAGLRARIAESRQRLCVTCAGAGVL